MFENMLENNESGEEKKEDNILSSDNEYSDNPLTRSESKL